MRRTGFTFTYTVLTRVSFNNFDKQRSSAVECQSTLCCRLKGDKRSEMTEKPPAATVIARTVLQQCLHGRLQVKPADEHSEAEWVEIDRGMVIYVCFFKGATDNILPKMVSTLLNLRLCESDSGKYVSVLELPGNLLIVPQATLGGKAKGRTMQYHTNIGKEDGQRLYHEFVSLCEKEVMQAGGETGNAATELQPGAVVKHGTYGNRQVLKLDTNGPYTHLMEF